MAVDASEVALLRLVAQRLAGPRAPDAASAVRELLAAQAQDLRGALVSVALRAPGPDLPGPGAAAGSALAGVRAALDDGSVVRSWPVRGTLHLVAAEDLGWLLALTTERLVRGAASRRAALGIDEPMVERARGVVVDALRGGGALGRAAVLGLWEEAGLLRRGERDVPQRGYHLLWMISQTGSTCWGPVLGGGSSDEQALVLLEEWVPSPRRLEREESLGELARRYLASHGPASTADLARWCGLVARDVRAGVALARPHLESLECDGVELLMDPATPERLAACRADARRTMLLPGFDEMVLGYADRSATVPAEHAGRVVPGANGIFLATVVDDGRVVGTWRRTGRRTGPPVAATPFTTFSDQVERALPGLGAALPA